MLKGVPYQQGRGHALKWNIVVFDVTMKLAICVPPGACDCYGHLQHYADRLADLGRRRSIEVEILHYNDGDFLARLFTNLGRDDCIVHFHSYLYDLTLRAYTVPPRIMHALETAKAVTLATVSDHPFSNIMRDMIENAHPSTRFMVVDRTFPDEMRFLNPGLRETRFHYTPCVAPINFDDTIQTPFEAREWDLVLPLLVFDQSKIDMGKYLADFPDGWAKAAAQQTYEIAVSDTSRNTFHVFAERVNAVLGGATLDDIKSHNPTILRVMLRLLDGVDGRVRHNRRHNMVRSLLRSVGDLKVAMLGHRVDSLHADKNVAFVGTCQTGQATRLMAASKAIFNCNPTYPTNIHERVAVGMLYGSCVITDVNPGIEALFSPEHYITYTPTSKMTIADIFQQDDIASIARRSAENIHAHAGFSWDAHFNDVLAAAAV